MIAAKWCDVGFKGSNMGILIVVMSVGAVGLSIYTWKNWFWDLCGPILMPTDFGLAKIIMDRLINMIKWPLIILPIKV